MRFLILALLICSCSVIKSLKKDKSQTKSEIQVEENKTKETEKETLTKTTTTQNLDSLFKIDGSTLSTTVDFRNLSTGWVVEDSNQKITIDSAGNLKAVVKPRIVPIRVKKTVVREEKIKEVVKEKSDSTGTSKTKDKIQTKDVKRTGIPWWWFLILLLIAVGYYLYRKYKP